MSYSIDLQKIADELDFDLEDVEMLLEVFLEGAEESLVELKNGVQTNNLENIFTSAHSIKGSASNLLLNDISDIAKEMENAARDNNDINYQEKYDELNLLIQEIKN